jgi:hypothetical protein
MISFTSPLELSNLDNFRKNISIQLDKTLNLYPKSFDYIKNILAKK